MSTWNYRVVKKNVNGEIIFGIHEGFYDDDGNLEGITEDPVTIYAEESVEKLKKELEYIITALEAEPVIYEEVLTMRMDGSGTSMSDGYSSTDEDDYPPDIMDAPIDTVVIE